MNELKLAACLILSRPGPTGDGEREILLVKRAKNLSFMGGYYVFPGGCVGRADHTLASHADLNDGAQRSAALRELFEETGVLLGTHQITEKEKETLRKQLLVNDSPWMKFQQTSPEPLFLDGLKFLTTWVTPACVPQRYEANYYLYELSKTVDVQVCNEEITDAIWLTPTQALNDFYLNGLELSYPVLETLRALKEAAHNPKQAEAYLQHRQRDSVDHFGGEMFSGIYMVPVRTYTLPPATHTNCYFLGHEELVIIDPATPIPDEQEKLISYIEFLKNQGQAFKEIWLTHQHKDHIGAVEIIRQHFNLPVAAHPLTAESLEGEITIDRLIHDGDENTLRINERKEVIWQAVHTPGHASGHLCFYEKQFKTLISGDHVVGLGTVIIAPPEGNMRDYFASLDKLNALPLNFMFPAHGPPNADPHKKIDEYIAHRTMREESIFSVLTEPLSAEAIVPLVYTELNPQIYPLAQINVQAHLEKLLSENRITQNNALYKQNPEHQR